MALPFALVGAAAGWLSAGFLANPIVDLSCKNEQRLAAACAAVVAAGVGAWLTRRCGPASVFADRNATRVRVVLAVSIGGVLSGASVGALSWASVSGAVAGGMAGFVCGLAFMPVCILVVAAAHRAARARLGTLVAASDRREMWGILATSLAVTTLAALPDWPASASRPDGAPVVALSMALAAGALLAGFVALDAIAIGRVARVARAHAGMEPRGEADADGGVPEIDLGLGDDVAAKMARGGSAYRASERAVARIVGSPARARAALREAIVRKLTGAGLVGATLAAHFVANLPVSTLLYDEHRCAQGRALSCRTAALFLGRLEESGSDPPRAAALYERGCTGPFADAPSCAGLAALLEDGSLGGQDTSRAAPFRAKACDAGDAPSCRVLAHTLLHTDRPDRDLPRAADLVMRGCARGDAVSCRESAVVQSAARFDDAARPLALGCIEGRAGDCDGAAAIAQRAWYGVRATELYERACDLGQPQSCHTAAWFYAHEALDEPRAARLYEQACRGGARFSCCEAAWLYVHGKHLPRDVERAHALYRLADDAGFGHAGACDLLARAHD